jgi:hypothetical protein
MLCFGWGTWVTKKREQIEAARMEFLMSLVRVTTQNTKGENRNVN